MHHIHGSSSLLPALQVSWLSSSANAKWLSLFHFRLLSLSADLCGAGLWQSCAKLAG